MSTSSPHSRPSSRPRPLSFGAEPSGERLERIRRSPHFDTAAGAFRNPLPTSSGRPPEPTAGGRLATARALLGGRARRRPARPVPLRRPDLSAPPATGLRITWCGHSSVLAEIDGARVLFDPVWGERCSPFTFAGPRRLHPVPVPLEALGPVDVVVVSHDHYDHLDLPTVQRLAATGTRFAVPLGVGAHLERWGVDSGQVTELDWHESTTVAGLTLTATPARHFCGRGLRNAQRTLWASWVVAGPVHRIFHSGDTGYFPGFAELGSAYGPFDVTMIQIGAYSEFWPDGSTSRVPLPGAWPDIHMTPAQGVRTHRDLQQQQSVGVMLPIHWGTFNLAPHPWAEPAEWTVDAAAEADVQVTTPRPGESFEPAENLPSDHWWRAASSPIRHPWRLPEARTINPAGKK